MSKPLRSLRLTPKSDYARFPGNRGEIFYDPVNETLRVFDSETQGGSVLATRTWVNTASTVNYNNLTNKPALSTVATTGSYTDLINRPETSQWKISADDSTVLTVPADESVSFRGQGMITTTVSNDSTGVQMIITAPELTQFIDVNQALGSETLIPSEFAAKGYADLLFNLQTAQLQNGTLDTTLNSVQFNSGVPIAEFSNDITFVDNSTSAVPTEAAVRGYIDRRLGNDQDGQVINPVNKIGPTYVITTGQQTIDLSTGQSTSDGDATFNADGVMLAGWIASLTTTRSLNIINLTAGRFMKIYVRNTNGSSRIVQINASATAEGLAPVNLAAGAGAVSVSQITLAATSGSAVITVWNTGSGTIVGMVN
jgi:hypothetical protein